MMLFKRPGVFGRGRQKRGRRYPYKPLAVVDAVSAVIPLSSTVADLGAGSGKLARLLKAKGYNIFGVDGTIGIDTISGGLVRQYDLAGDCSELRGAVDWAIFLNVGEHVPKEDEEALIRNVGSVPTTGLVVAWGDPETPDNSPLNPRYDYWVANRFGAAGWTVDEAETIRARGLVGDYSRLDERLLVMRMGT